MMFRTMRGFSQALLKLHRIQNISNPNENDT